MAKVYLLCGKICSGKTFYARRLLAQYHAVLLSTDEATFDLIQNEQGEFYNIFARRVNNYLQKKAAEIAKAGANAVLDWGFWTREDRSRISAYFTEQQVDYEWHYIDIPEALWEKNIAERNARIEAGQGGSDFYVDAGLLEKLKSMFEVPAPEEIDVWYHPETDRLQ